MMQADQFIWTTLNRCKGAAVVSKDKIREERISDIFLEIRYTQEIIKDIFFYMTIILFGLVIAVLLFILFAQGVDLPWPIDLLIISLAGLVIASCIYFFQMRGHFAHYEKISDEVMGLYDMKKQESQALPPAHDHYNVIPFRRVPKT